MSMYFLYCQKVTCNKKLSEIFIIQTEGSLTQTFLQTIVYSAKHIP